MIAAFGSLGGCEAPACRSVILASVPRAQPTFLGGGYYGLEGFPTAPPGRQKASVRVTHTDEGRYFSRSGANPQEQPRPASDPVNEEDWLVKAIEAISDNGELPATGREVLAQGGPAAEARRGAAYPQEPT